jgi:hypothetical protein
VLSCSNHIGEIVAEGHEAGVLGGGAVVDIISDIHKCRWEVLCWLPKCYDLSTKSATLLLHLALLIVLRLSGRYLLPATNQIVR